MSKAALKGKVITYVNGEWADGNVPVIGALDDGGWLGATVFDGARAFDGVIPDLELHCARSIRSAQALGMEPKQTAEDIIATVREGVAKFNGKEALYICPMFYMAESFFGHNPDATKFVMTICEAPLDESDGFTACLTKFRRPSRDSATTDAKAASLYPNVTRSVRAASERGFDVAVMLDPSGNVAEFSFSNLFMVKDGVVHTPAINGTFLNGITRQRVIKLLRENDITVEERFIDFAELLEADELFSTGNYSKVVPCTALEDKVFGIGPMYKKARALYFDWATKG